MTVATGGSAVGHRTPLFDLARHGDQTAVVTADGQLTYRDLDALVDAMVERLGPTRRLIVLCGANDTDTLVAYLAALRGGHPLIFTGGADDGRVRDITDAYDPDVVIAPGDHGLTLDERRPGTTHELHPDLAVLLSTSGSTGSPKLVRLSHDNLAANASAIAEYLDIRATDRAPTTLPMHYSYGLSVVNSHLLQGATLALTTSSVVEPAFWDLFHEVGATSLAGVPYTYDLLDRVGFADMATPTLRHVTQAGGRLAPAQVRRYADLGRRRGFDFFVMYGQTEATARMAYLPPDLAAHHPQAIGGPIPGGTLRLRPVDGVNDPACGELVYSGANVMLGYARSSHDLALGRTVDELSTGDLARRCDAGLYEIVGRLDRHAKVFGLRIDLDRVERTLTAEGVRAACVARGECLMVTVEGDISRMARSDLEVVRERAVSSSGLPARAVRVTTIPQLPVNGHDKVDYRAVEGLTVSETPRADAGPAKATTSCALRDLYAELLGREDATEDDSFVSLGGDSLSFVEMSLRLEDLLGELPREWHTTPIRRLVPAPPARGRALDTSVVLRATAILLIVNSHANLLALQGGAHLLLAIAGFNFARFQLSAPSRTERRRHVLASIGRIAVPSMCWIAGVGVLLGSYGVANVFFLNFALGTPNWTTPWQYWFLETLIWTLVGALVILAVPAVDRAERRAPFGFALVLLAATLAVRFAFVGVEATAAERYTPWALVWFFALGWAASRAASRPRRLLVSAVAAATVTGFFASPSRELLIVLGVALLTWVGTVRVPRWLGRSLATLASSSLYIYLTHWQVYPHLEDRFPVLAVVASIAVGVCYRLLVTLVRREVVPRLRAVAVERARAT